MKLPVPPPTTQDVVASFATPGAAARLGRLVQAGLGPAPGGKYRHWDTFRHAPPLTDISAKEQWAMVKLARMALYRQIPLTDSAGAHFRYALPNVALEMLHQIDRDAAGNIRASEQVRDPATKDTYLFKSIVEEAITSSQLEGASTTRKIAKAMIQEGRPPQTQSERMILNNYQGMRYALSMVENKLTPAHVLALHKVLTEGTLEDPDAAGRFRRAEEHIVIEDETGGRLHTPPPAVQLATRLQQMCAFANGGEDGEFIPPAVRAILLHFWLAYDHPFVDGNGRTARALFYWSMARQGYWLVEYVSISRILKKARAQYARAFLYSETDQNDATYFILYQLRVLIRAIAELHLYLARKAAEIRSAEDIVRKSAKLRDAFNPRQVALIDHALRNSDARYTVASHQRSHGVSYESARADLMKLTALRLLEQRKSGRAFVFIPGEDLLRKLEGKTRLRR